MIVVIFEAQSTDPPCQNCNHPIQPNQTAHTEAGKNPEVSYWVSVHDDCANARLIAASPDMLAALQMAESLFDRQGFQEMRGLAWNDGDRKQIQDAIKAATS